jgi:DNA-binding transcriptional regulator GbsR (MarR family)
LSTEPPYDAVRTDFIEKTGLISQAEGLPRIAGRIFGMLMFDGDVTSFGDIARALQVSRASISTSIRLLEERGLVRRLSKPGERQDFFELAPNPYATMLSGIQKRTQATRDEIAQTIEKLPADADAKGRLTDYADFYASLDAAVAVALENVNAKAARTIGQKQNAPKDQIDDR